MEIRRVLKSNWLTRKPSDLAEFVTGALSVLVAIVSWMYSNDLARTTELLTASGERVFGHHEYWRLWTSLLIHADLGHIVSNAVLFVPLSFFLTGYFGLFLFPVLGFFVGGLTNYLALCTMNPETQLLGISGLVYWMGAVWLTLYLLIGSRESRRRRAGKTLFIAAALFLPQSFEPHVSYVSHLFGFVLGIPCALAYYLVRRREFLATEVYEFVVDSDLTDESADGEDRPPLASDATINGFSIRK